MTNPFLHNNNRETCPHSESGPSNFESGEAYCVLGKLVEDTAGCRLRASCSQSCKLLCASSRQRCSTEVLRTDMAEEDLTVGRPQEDSMEENLEEDSMEATLGQDGTPQTLPDHLLAD